MASDDDDAPTAGGEHGLPRPRHRVRAVVLSALAGVVGLGLVAAATWTVAKGQLPWDITTPQVATPMGGGSQPAVDPPVVEPGKPLLVTAEQLSAWVTARTGVVYWAGPRESVSYELTETGAGDVYIRYLPTGVEAGSPEADFLTVATYRLSGGYAQLQAAGGASGATATTTESGALVVTQKSAPGSVYFSFPGADFQVEVFSPESGTAAELVLNGTVAPLT